MNIWGKSERSWRRKHKRAVSPIIATILLVAITVVLAAVLYILIQQYTKSGSSGTPLGGALSVGSSTDSTGASSAITACTATATCSFYNMSVQSASSTLTLGSLAFQVKTVGGSIVTGPTGVAVIGLTGGLIGTYTFSSSAWTFTTGSGYSTTTVLSTEYTLVLYQPSTSTSLVGDVFYALGSGAFSGSVQQTIT